MILGYSTSVLILIIILSIIICYFKIYKLVRQSFRRVSRKIEISAIDSVNEIGSTYNQAKNHWRIAQKVILVY